MASFFGAQVCQVEAHSAGMLRTRRCRSTFLTTGLGFSGSEADNAVGLWWTQPATSAGGRPGSPRRDAGGSGSDLDSRRGLVPP